MSNIDFKGLLKKYEQESIDALRPWIQIDSVYDESTSTKEKPFGEGVSKALEYIACLAEKEGFNVDRCNGYCTEISFGEGDLIAIYAHADVVPISGKWTKVPFGAEIVDDIMYGRGTSDDKGPAMAAFYALKALKENNLINDYKVSLVIGGNEESGSRCLEYYFHTLHKPYPKYGFTPDGNFPLIYGEKGITGYSHTMNLNLKDVISIKAGVASNSVIDEARAKVNKNSLSKESLDAYFSSTKATYSLTQYEDYDELVVYGKSSHGSMPLLGVNAGLHLLEYLANKDNLTDLKRVCKAYLETDGKEFDTFVEGKYLHETTYNVGLMEYSNNKLEMIVNFRYPENCDPKEIEAKLIALNLGEIKFYGYGETLLFEPETPFIQTLLKVYQEETGDYKTPIMTIGGGTYAKETKNSVAFGSAFPGRNDKIHSPDEEIHISDYLSSQSIYARAIYELGKLD